MSYIKRAIEEIRDRGWPQTNESLERLVKEKEKQKEKDEKWIENWNTKVKKRNETDKE